MEKIVNIKRTTRIVRSTVVPPAEYYYTAPREDYPLEMTMWKQNGKQYQENAFVDDDHDHDQFHQNPISSYTTTTHYHQSPCVAYNTRPYYGETRKIAPNYKLPHHDNYLVHHHHDDQEDQNYQPNMPMNSPHQQQVVKKPSGVMDCKEAAKRFGGVVFTQYGRNNKFSHI
ncbi:hypothetical protein CsatB_025814 [Cannabis sativa]|uniref:Uncharacterized protein n=1 Tax=Cannabis sativa TaxID=3483 RepID=A0A803R7J5_CANSA